MPGRQHSREFKIEIVQSIERGEKTIAQLCREHNLSPGLVHRWRKEVDARGAAAFTDRTSNPDQSLEQRIAELERFCGQLSLENTILKKSLATYRSKTGTK